MWLRDSAVLLHLLSSSDSSRLKAIWIIWKQGNKQNVLFLLNSFVQYMINYCSKFFLQPDFLWVFAWILLCCIFMGNVSLKSCYLSSVFLLVEVLTTAMLEPLCCQSLGSEGLVWRRLVYTKCCSHFYPLLGLGCSLCYPDTDLNV